MQCRFATQDPLKGSAQIAAEIQHKDPFLADKGAIEDVLAVENDVVPFDRANVLQQPRVDSRHLALRRATARLSAARAGCGRVAGGQRAVELAPALHCS